MKEIILTGIKSTGILHLGNYFGAIKPAIDLINSVEGQHYLFIADYHSLTTVTTKAEMEIYSFDLACSWLACGIDPEKVVFYKQSTIPETFELFTILNNVTPKGLMNRAHAYKASVDENIKSGLDQDANINMGLYNYPILMAADILLFNTTKVPVGQDQKQHIEIARDIASSFNYRYGKILVEPVEYIQKEVATVVGLDGRKMSKSYKNQIELFSDESKLKKSISKIVTDSRLPGEPKDKDNNVYELYKLVASKTELKEFEENLLNGLSWGEAKNVLFNKMNEFLLPMREKYNYYKSHPSIVNEILNRGTVVARRNAVETINKVKEAIGVI